MMRNVKFLSFIFFLCLSFICFPFMQPDGWTDATSGAFRTAYLQNNIHAQWQPGKGGAGVYKASYANWTDPGAGHYILPVNAFVEIGVERGWKGRRLLITDQKDGKQIYMEVNERNIGMSIEDYINIITSSKMVRLENLSKIDRKGIREGKAFPGMTKDGVRIALGYPSPHRTPSLQSNRWVYWKNRFRNFAVNFDANGKVR